MNFRKMRNFLGVLSWFALANVAVAQDVLTEFDPERSVELRAVNGATQVIGELRAIEDGFFIVRTELGDLRIATDSVTCEGPGCPAKSDGSGFAIHVSNDIEPRLVAEALRAYANTTGANLEVLDTGDLGQQNVRLTNSDGVNSTDISFFNGESGFLALASGQAQISVQSQPISDEAGIVVSGPALDALIAPQNQTVIAQDAVVVAVNPRNPVRNLSRAEIGQVFSGEISNWLELGGGNVPISVYGVSGEHALSGDFASYFLNDASQIVQTASLFDTNASVAEAVRDDIGGIGFLSRAEAEATKSVAIRENCGLLTRPDAFTIKTDGYPLSRPIYAYRRPSDMDPNAEAIYQWLTSANAETAIRRAGFADQGLDRVNLEDMGMMLIHSAAVETDFSLAQYSRMLRELRDAERLSISFRFETGATELDEESKGQLARLGARMEAGEFAGLELLIVGFADSSGPSALNTEIADGRARAVRDILVDAVSSDVTSRLRLRPVSYGELLPLACNDDEAGRSNNRRVEIWVRRLGARTN